MDGLRELLRSASIGGGRNFRALAGMQSRDGRTIPPGRVFRSGCLSQLSSDFRAQLETFHIRTVVTFQTSQELEILGDALATLMPSAVREHIPIGDRWFRPGGLELGLLDSMSEFYVRIFREHGELWSRFFRVFTEAERFPVLFHCTAGRDRTGVATVLLLEALGIEREAIVEDYLVSNLVFRESVHEPEVLAPLFAAIDDDGGIEAVLASVGLGADDLDSIRRNLLTDE